MEVSGELHAPAALLSTLEEKVRRTHWKDADWVPEPA
jgi:hypothetical protein